MSYPTREVGLGLARVRRLSDRCAAGHEPDSARESSVGPCDPVRTGNVASCRPARIQPRDRAATSHPADAATAPRPVARPDAHRGQRRDFAAAGARRARAHGRIGIDTEFMSEGRYRALLCLVQIAVDDDNPDGAAAHLADRPARRDRRDAARAAAGRPGDRGRASTPAARTWRSCAGRGAPRSRTSSTPSSRPGSRARARRPATATCSARCSAAGSARPRATRAGTPGR